MLTLKAIFFSTYKTLILKRSLCYKPSLVLGLALLCIAQTANADFSAKVELSSSRVFRGAAQTDNNPAPSFRGQYNHESGFYLGTLVSRNDFRTRTIRSREHAYFFGYGTEINRTLNIDLSYIRYDYQRPSAGPSRDWQEVHLRIGIADNTALTLGTADGWFGPGTRTGQVELSQIHSLTVDFSLQGTLGAIVSSSDRKDYGYAELGLIYGFNDVAYIRADVNMSSGGAETMFRDRADTNARISIGYLF